MSENIEKILIDEVQLSTEIKIQTAKSITNGTELHLLAYIINPIAEEALKYFIDTILERFNQIDLQMTVAIILKEIVTNAAKANLKYFLTHLQKNNATEVDSDFLIDFRKKLQSDAIAAYRTSLQEAKLNIKITLKYDAGGILIAVSNGFAVTGQEETRLTEKFNQALNVSDIRQFYKNNHKDAEGAGLGFTLVINALKSAGINPDNFYFSTGAGGLTTASVSIPFEKKVEANIL